MKLKNSAVYAIVGAVIVASPVSAQQPNSKLISTTNAPTEVRQIPGAFAQVAVPGGTAVTISLLEELASNTAHAGDRVRFKSLEPVVSGGWIVIEKDAVGEAEVLSAEGAGGNGHSGQMQIKFDWIYGVDGMKIALSDLPETSNGRGGKGAASTASLASYLLLGPIGLFAHNFVRGKDIVIKPDQKLRVYVAETVHIMPATRDSSADSFAH